MFNIVRDWRGGKKAASTFFFLCLTSSISLADNGTNNQGRTDYDLDDDGLIEINDHYDLNEIRNDLTGSSLYGSNIGCPISGCRGFELTTNIDLDTNADGVIDINDEYWNADAQGNGLGWQPIGSIDTPFSAEFQGNGYLIRNLYINRPDEYFVGFFANTGNAEIFNIGFTGPLMSVTGGYFIGAITGYVTGNTLILAAFNTGNISTGPIHNGSSIGGLVGQSAGNTTISVSFNTGDVNGGNSGDIGGLIGLLGARGSIASSFNAGKVSGNTGIIGGLVGVAAPEVVHSSHWAIDSSTQTNGSNSISDNYSFGVSLKTLQCVDESDTHLDKESCFPLDAFTDPDSKKILYSGWILDRSALVRWDFGNENQLPGLKVYNGVNSGIVHRDSDGDGILDEEDQYIYDSDNDGVDNRSDAFPFDSAASLDRDADGYPDEWLANCDITCQQASELTFDPYLFDTDNDGIRNYIDNDDNGDGIIDADADSDGMIDITSLAQLNAIRHQLNGAGLRMESGGSIDQSGCPIYNYNNGYVQKCRGYELVTDLDFDSNFDGVIDEHDEYWNADIEGNGLGWEPIGTFEQPFTSLLQGNGHIIQNLFINRPNTTDVGLFGYINKAKIESIGLKGTSLSITGFENVGALVGRAENYSHIKYSFNTGPVQGEKFVGGIVGRSSEFFLTSSFNTGHIFSGQFSGGLIGDAFKSEIITSFNTGSVTHVGEGGAGSGYAGGLTGGIYLGRISASFDAGMINRPNYNRLAAFVISSEISNSYWATGGTRMPMNTGIDNYFGVVLSSLQCPRHANTSFANSDCLSEDGSVEGRETALTLFNSWDTYELNNQPLWDFGTDQQLPGLILNGVLYRDSDADGILDEDDQFIFDTDNDGVDNRDDAYPFISLDGLADFDGDGIPDVCDTTCIESGMTHDIDNDNDGVSDANDAFPLDPTEWADADGNGIGDNADVIVKRPSTIPTHIAYHGWTTMMNTLSGQNTQGSTSPSPEHDPSLYALVGEMYIANGIYDYIYDFHYLPEGPQAINNPLALDHINNTDASVVILSANGTDLGITSDPSKLRLGSSWVNKTVVVAEEAKRRNITPILFQAWGNSTEAAHFKNAKRNSDALQAKTGLLVIRSAEIVDALGKINSDYIINSNSPNGKHTVPVNHLYSGDVTDDHSASYALSYANALATFKVLTGISAKDNTFVIPSSNITDENYGMSDEFISDIISAVDDIQKESLTTELVEGDGAKASYFTRSATEGEFMSINIPLAANLHDDENINPNRLRISYIDESDFNYYLLNNGIFTFNINDSTQVGFVYEDIDGNTTEFIMNLNNQSPTTVESQEIIIGFGEGNWSRFTASDDLYNHGRTETNKVINGIRGFDSLATQGQLKDVNGRNIGSVTSFTEGILSGPGFGANAISGISDYGPYTALYDGLSIAPTGSRVSFSINGLEEGTLYKVNIAGRYLEETENIVNVNVNGVRGYYDSNGRPDNNSEYEKIVAVNADGQLVITLKSDGDTFANYWGISYLHLNKIISGELEDATSSSNFYIQPENQSVTLGGNVTFEAAATKAETYQWYRNGELIKGAIAQKYTLTTQEEDHDAEFYVRAGTDYLYSYPSRTAKLTITTDLPSIEVQPLTYASVIEGNKLVLNVTAIDALTYQWQKDGVDIYGETKARLSTPVSAYDNGSVYTVLVSNAFGNVLSDEALLTVTEEDIEYWFSFGRSDGHAAPFESFSYNSIPAYDAYGYNGESINFIRSLPTATTIKSNVFRNIDGNLTDLSVTYSNIGTNTNPINGWNLFNPDILLNSNTMFNLAMASWLDHSNLYAYYVYLANNQAIQFDFSQGGLTPGDTWQVQALGMHYQDRDRPVDVTVNGEGTPGNMHVGVWDDISVFEQTTTVDGSGLISVQITPQINANINAIRLIRTAQ